MKRIKKKTNKNVTILKKKKKKNYNKLTLFRELNFLVELCTLRFKYGIHLNNGKKIYIYMLSCSRLGKTKR